MSSSQDDSPDSSPDTETSTSVPFSTTLNSNFSRPPPLARHSSRGKETAYPSTADAFTSGSRLSRPPLDVLHDLFQQPSSSLSGRDSSHPRSPRVQLPPANSNAIAPISNGSTSIRRTHSVYEDDETTDDRSETPPKRLKLSFTLTGSPTALSGVEVSSPLCLSSTKPPSSVGSKPFPGTLFTSSLRDHQFSESPSTDDPTPVDSPSRHGASEGAFNSPLRLRPPLISYQPHGLGEMSSIRSTLQPSPALGLEPLHPDQMELQNETAGSSIVAGLTTPGRPSGPSATLTRFPSGVGQDVDDDDATMSLDEHASLPSPRLSPVSAINVNASPSLLPQDQVDNSPCISRRGLWPHSDEWQQWNIGALTPQVVRLSGSMLEKTSAYSSMMDWFTSLPPESQAFVFSQMFSKSSINVLRYAANTASTALKMDIFAALPVELSRMVVSHLDARALCQAAQVSKTWRSIVDTDEATWHKLFHHDGFTIPEGELERAVREGWGWQDPVGRDGHEIDISTLTSTSSRSSSHQPSNLAVDAESSPRLSNRLRRKAASKPVNSSSRRSNDSRANQLATLIQKFGEGCPSYTYSRAALLQVPDSSVGIASLRQMHLFKSLYRRHHLIRQAWLDPETKPYHLAFHVQHRHVITCLQFDSEKILTGSDNTNIHVYDTRTGERLSSLPGHSGGVWALQYTGNTLVSGSTDRSVRIWDIEKARCLHTFQGHTSTVRCLLIVQPSKVGENEDGSPRMMPQYPLIVTGSRDSTIRVWRLPQPDDRSVFQSGPPMNEHDNPYFVRVLAGHEHSVRAIAAHGDTLVSGSYDFTVRVWEISTGKCRHHLTGHTNKVYSVVLDHQRKRCISGSMDNLVKIWSTDTGECLFNLKGHTNLVGLLDLNQNLLVSAAADSTLRVWDPDTGRCLSTLSSHSGTITCFQHDGYKAISGGDKTLKMWDIRSGECVGDLLTNLSAVWQVRFDDRRCVAAVQRNTHTYIEVLDFGASRDGIPASRRGIRILVDKNGVPISSPDDTDDALVTPVA